MIISNSIDAASRIARALGDMTGTFGGMPIRVLVDHDDLDVSRTVFDIAGAIGYNCVPIDADDFADGTEQRERIASCIMRRSAPALFVVDDTEGVEAGGMRADEARLELLGTIARIARDGWDARTVVGLVVITKALTVDVASSLGKSLDRTDWPGYIKM